MAKVKTGHERKRSIKAVSKISIVNKIIRSKNIKKVFTKIPITIEKTTKPFLYSFFKGLKNVLIKIDKESISKDARLSEKKKRIKPIGASAYQNLRKSDGNCRQKLNINFTLNALPFYACLIKYMNLRPKLQI